MEKETSEFLPSEKKDVGKWISSSNQEKANSRCSALFASHFDELFLLFILLGRQRNVEFDFFIREFLRRKRNSPLLQSTFDNFRLVSTNRKILSVFLFSLKKLFETNKKMREKNKLKSVGLRLPKEKPGRTKTTPKIDRWANTAKRTIRDRL